MRPVIVERSDRRCGNIIGGEGVVSQRKRLAAIKDVVLTGGVRIWSQNGVMPFSNSKYKSHKIRSGAIYRALNCAATKCATVAARFQSFTDKRVVIANDHSRHHRLQPALKPLGHHEQVEMIHQQHQADKHHRHRHPLARIRHKADANHRFDEERMREGGDQHL